MQDPDFGELTEVTIRNAWTNEARDFTPWLARNLERLGREVGLNLELISCEVGLPSTDDSFAADILARDLQNDANVLIENQLEKSDHTHLGQILTYLSGLEAKSIIWVAPRFREAHLAAIKWLNENTTPDFRFFAVAIRVVQIGDSKMAPLFDVLEKPNQWERQIQLKTRNQKESSPIALERERFWKYFFDRFPQHTPTVTAGKQVNIRKILLGGRVQVSYFLGKNSIGIFVRGPEGEAADDFANFVDPKYEDLAVRLGTRQKTSYDWPFFKWQNFDLMDNSQHPSMAEWFNRELNLYEQSIIACLDIEG